MDNDLIATLAVTFASGSALTLLFEYFRNRGKACLSEQNLTCSIRTLQLRNLIVDFELDLQFINTSGNQKIISSISASMYDGHEYVPLAFEGHNIMPSDILEARKVKTMKYRLRTPFHNTPMPLISDGMHVVINYSINGKRDARRIDGYSIGIIDVTHQWHLVGL